MDSGRDANTFFFSAYVSYALRSFYGAGEHFFFWLGFDWILFDF